ncbi:MAG TPA: hypothetical protein VGG59_10800 [Acidobacteriaceae bacterium]|jgi:hypothetical protein
MGTFFGGGPSGQQKNQAAEGLAGTASTSASNQQQQYNQMAANQQAATGFYRNQMQNGLPFYRNLTDYNAGNVAQAFAPQRAQMLRQIGTYSNLPSGYRDALMTNLNAQQGRTFDSSLTQAMMANEMAKQQGAAGMQGQQQLAGNMALGYGNMGAGANQALLQAPQRSGIGGMLGGLAGAGLGALGQIGMGGGFGAGGAFAPHQ